MNRSNLVKLVHPNRRVHGNNIEIFPRAISLINQLQRIPISIATLPPVIDQYTKLFNQLNDDIKLNTIDNKSKLAQLRFKLNEFSIRLSSYSKLYNIMNEYGIKAFYYSYSMDFRGRIYATSVISPTSDKIMRNHLKFLQTPSETTAEFDATASILQILAMISLNIDLLKITNLIHDDSHFDT